MHIGLKLIVDLSIHMSYHAFFYNHEFVCPSTVFISLHCAPALPPVTGKQRTESKDYRVPNFMIIIILLASARVLFGHLWLLVS